MPKTKKKSESTSDSDSGPDDRAPAPPAKKTKESNDAATKSKASTSGESEKEWVLEKMRRVRVSDFRGRPLVDIREFYEKDGKILPGKKGISLSATQWRKLLEVADDVNKALQET